MARKTKSGRHQLNLAEELNDILSQFTEDLQEKKEIALNKATDFLLDKLEQNTPVDTGTMKASWTAKYQYKGVRYIGNTAVGGKNKYGYSIPLSNLVEFSKNGTPFIRKTFDTNKEDIVKIIKEELEK